MIQRASSVGELASRMLSRGRQAIVTRAFPRSAYLRTGADFMLILWGETRSPMTVNVVGRRDALTGLKVGDRCQLGPSGLHVGEVAVEVGGAKVYHSSLLGPREVVLPTEGKLVKGVAMLKSLYDASPQGLTLPDDSSFRRFATGTLVTYGAGQGGRVPRLGDLLGLVGRGGGFTPAGDDFTAGFAAAFNFIARCRGTRQIAVPLELLSSRTIPESAAIVAYSGKGYVDEEVERLILASTGANTGSFSGDILALATRGHTSGLDISLGVLLAVACASDAMSEGSAVELCLTALWGIV